MRKTMKAGEENALEMLVDLFDWLDGLERQSTRGAPVAATVLCQQSGLLTANGMYAIPKSSLCAAIMLTIQLAAAAVASRSPLPRPDGPLAPMHIQDRVRRYKAYVVARILEV